MFTLNWDYEQVKMRFSQVNYSLDYSQVKMGKQGMNLALTY